MTDKKEKALAEIQRTTAKDRLPFLLAVAAIIALVLALIASWLGIIKPVAAADLSNGAFCVKVTNDKEPEINATAGNCRTAPAPVERPISIDWTNTVFWPEADDPNLWTAQIIIRTTRDTPVAYYRNGVMFASDPVNPSGHPAPILFQFHIGDGSPLPEIDLCVLNPTTQERSHCERVDLSQFEQ